MRDTAAGPLASPGVTWRAIAGAAALSALLFGLSFPSASMRELAWICLVPLLIVLRRSGFWTGVAFAAMTGVLHGASVGLWWVDAVAGYFGRSAWFGLLFFIGMAATMIAPYYAGFAAAHKHAFALCGSRPWFPLLVAALWVTFDFARGTLFTGSAFFIGNPWALIGYSQTPFLPLAQIASVTGIYGVSFAVVCFNAGLAQLLDLGVRGFFSVRSALVTMAISLFPALAVALFGIASLRSAPPADPVAGTPVVVVQGNLDDGARWSPDLYGQHLDAYLELTIAALQRTPARLVIWPESALSFFVAQEPLYRRAISRITRHFSAELMVGGPYSESDPPEPPYFNSVYLISPDGEIRSRYDKEYLVPFSEYFPLRDLDFLRRRFERVRVFAHGAERPVIQTAAGAAGVLICNEAMLPGVAARRIAQGAEYLVNPSNDSWILHPQFAELQFDIVALRAVEQRRYLVRASTSGPSAIVDPWGRVLRRTEMGSADAFAGVIVPLEGLSVYARAGDLFAYSCVATTLTAWALAVRRRTR